MKGECKEAAEAGDAEQVEDLRQKWPKRAHALLAKGQSATSASEPLRKRFRVETSHLIYKQAWLRLDENLSFPLKP